jgi:hypothetical protein
MLSIATAVPTNIVGSNNKTSNATATGTQTKVPTGPTSGSSSGGAKTTGTGSGNSSSSGAVAAFNSIPLAGLGSFAFGAVAFFMVLFV